MDSVASPLDIDKEERALALQRFNSEDAWWLGNYLRDKAIDAKAPIAIEISRSGTRVFSFLLPGATRDNLCWISRKVAMVMRFERSSYALAMAFQADAAAFSRSGLDLINYIDAGGAAPIRLAGGIVIGSVAVSGLPQEEDHKMVIDALSALKDHQALDIPT